MISSHCEHVPITHRWAP